MTSSDKANGRPSPYHRAWILLKWLLFAVVVVFVGRRGWSLWLQESSAVSGVQVSALWLVAAAVVYALGWLPSVWFWHRLMQRLGGRMRFGDTMRAYYCGHLGKYVPGKATVLVIRTAMMRDRGISMAATAVTATAETVLLIAAGAALAVSLVSLLVPPPVFDSWPGWVRPAIAVPWVPACVVVVLAALALPVVSQILSYLAVRMTPKSFRKGGQAVRIEASLIAAGLAAFVLSWFVHGMSLGLVIRGVGGSALDVSDWPVWAGAAAGSTAVGFLAVFAPGGIGVREGVLIEVLRLQPGMTSQTAVAAAVMLRVVWLLTEIGIAVALYYVLRPSAGTRSESP